MLMVCFYNMNYSFRQGQYIFYRVRAVVSVITYNCYFDFGEMSVHEIIVYIHANIDISKVIKDILKKWLFGSILVIK